MSTKLVWEFSRDTTRCYVTTRCGTSHPFPIRSLTSESGPNLSQGHASAIDQATGAIGNDPMANWFSSHWKRI